MRGVRSGRDRSSLGEACAAKHVSARVTMKDGGPELELGCARAAGHGFGLGGPFEGDARVVAVVKDAVVEPLQQIGGGGGGHHRGGQMAALLGDGGVGEHEAEAVVELALGELGEEDGGIRGQVQGLQSGCPEVLLPVGREENVGDAGRERFLEERGGSEMNHRCATGEDRRDDWMVYDEDAVQLSLWFRRHRRSGGRRR